MSHELRAAHHPIIPEYVDFLKKKFTSYRDVPLRVVLDAGNGTAGLAAPEILRHMGCEVTELFSEPDGAFPNHHPDPTIPANLHVLIDTVRAQKADAGIAFDGDADRIGVVDEQGNILWGDQLMVIFARDILRRQPGATFVSEVKCSQTMYDDIRAHGGNAIMWKTGHSLIKAKMKEVDAAFAGEMSGHLFFADRYFGYDDAIYAACRLVEILKKIRTTAKKAHSSSLIDDIEPKTISHQLRANSLSSLLSDLPKTFNTPEIRIDCDEHIKFMVVERMEKIMAKGKDILPEPKEIITVDGVRVVFANGWGLIRASNTQPVLVMRFEATDPTSLEAVKTMMEEKVAIIISHLANQR
jgi:phosphomannomutase/phosphoglucomutase